MFYQFWGLGTLAGARIRRLTTRLKAYIFFPMLRRNYGGGLTLPDCSSSVGLGTSFPKA